MTFPLKIVGFLKSKSDIPRNGLIAEWLFSNNLNDTSGNGINLSQSGTVYFGGDRNGNPNSAAWQVNGTPATAYSRSAFDLGSYTTWSFSCWIYVVSGQSNRGFFGNGDIDQTLFKTIYFKVFSNSLYIVGIDTGVTIPYGVWTHLVFNVTNATNNIDIYKNGSFDTTETNYTITSNASEVTVGNAVSLTNSNYWRGGYDDYRFYNRLLTTDEITALYNE